MPDDARLSTLIAEARAAVPELVLDAAGEASLAEWLRARMHHGALHAGDVLIAMQCARGDERAIALFEKRCFEEIPFAQARVRSRASLDEIKQMMRDKLFVAQPGTEPRIAQYTGVGPLRAWFRVGLVRTMLNLATRGPEKRELDDEILAVMPAADADPDLEHARRTYGAMLKEVLAESIAGLDRRERAVLRFAVCEGLGIDALGEIYGVHRATAARWIAAAREKLQASVKKGLQRRLRAGDESLASVMRLADSKLDLSLRRHLATGGAPT